jgi:hypothetical protein
MKGEVTKDIENLRKNNQIKTTQWKGTPAD